MIKKVNLLALVGLSIITISANAIDTYDILQLASQENWHWQMFDNLKNLDNDTLTPKKITKTNNYFLTKTIDETQHITLTAYGSKQQPEVIVVKSESYLPENSLPIPEDLAIAKARLLRLNPQPPYFIPLKTNCRLANLTARYQHPKYTISAGGSLDSQNFYRYTQNSRPLYMSYAEGSGYVATSMMIHFAQSTWIITPNKEKLGKFVSQYGWHIDNKGREIECLIDD